MFDKFYDSISAIFRMNSCDIAAIRGKFKIYIFANAKDVLDKLWVPNSEIFGSDSDAIESRRGRSGTRSWANAHDVFAIGCGSHSDIVVLAGEDRAVNKGTSRKANVAQDQAILAI